MSETLKNCPYCGEEGLLLKKECGGYLGCIKDESCRGYAVRNFISGGFFDREIAAWNRRAAVEPVTTTVWHTELVDIGGAWCTFAWTKENTRRVLKISIGCNALGKIPERLRGKNHLLCEEVSANWGKWDKKTNTRYDFNFAVAEDTPEFQRYEDMSLAALIAESKRLLQHHVALNDYRDNY